MISRTHVSQNPIRFPPEMSEIWIFIFEFLSNSRLNVTSFYTLYNLTRELHEFPWRPYLAKLTFKVRQQCREFRQYNFSYVHTLDLTQFNEITNGDISWLSNIPSLIIHSHQITDQGLRHLKGIDSLSLRGNHQITDKGLAFLKGIQSLDLEYCEGITDRGLTY